MSTTQTDLNLLKYAELREKCRDYHLSQTGSKADLVNRLSRYFNQTKTSNPENPPENSLKESVINFDPFFHVDKVLYLSTVKFNSPNYVSIDFGENWKTLKSLNKINVQIICFIDSASSLEYPYKMDIFNNNEIISTVSPPKQLKVRKEVPINITPFIKTGLNKFKISAHQDTSKKTTSSPIYHMGIVYGHFLSVDDLLKKIPILYIKDKGYYQTFFKKLSNREVVCEDDSIIVSLTCPLSLCPISVPGQSVNEESEVATLIDPLKHIGLPARSRGCNHLSCFDLKAYLNVNNKTSVFNRRWNCPICFQRIKFKDLFVDGLIRNFISTNGGSLNDFILTETGDFILGNPQIDLKLNEDSDDSEDEETFAIKNIPQGSSEDVMIDLCDITDAPIKKPPSDVISILSAEDEIIRQPTSEIVDLRTSSVKNGNLNLKPRKMSLISDDNESIFSEDTELKTRQRKKPRLTPAKILKDTSFTEGNGLDTFWSDGLLPIPSSNSIYEKYASENTALTITEDQVNLLYDKMSKPARILPPADYLTSRSPEKPNLPQFSEMGAGGSSPFSAMMNEKKTVVPINTVPPQNNLQTGRQSREITRPPRRQTSRNIQTSIPPSRSAQSSGHPSSTRQPDPRPPRQEETRTTSLLNWNNSGQIRRSSNFNRPPPSPKNSRDFNAQVSRSLGRTISGDPNGPILCAGFDESTIGSASVHKPNFQLNPNKSFNRNGRFTGGYGGNQRVNSKGYRYTR